jgi:uncharacterized protein YxeA
MLDWGLPLSMPHTHEKIDGFTFTHTHDGDTDSLLEERVSEKAIREIANRKTHSVRCSVTAAFQLAGENKRVRYSSFLHRIQA